MSLLREKTYAEVLEEKGTYREPENNHWHSYSYRGTNERFIFLRCTQCGKIREIINPKYLSWFVKEKRRLAELARQPHQVKKPEVKLTAVDRAHIAKGIDSYEGDLRKDLLQPYNLDGSVNQEFVDTYGMPE